MQRPHDPRPRDNGRPAQPRPDPRGDAGFTMVELLIAITAGLFVAIGAFALARQGSRFFQQEARIANAQFAAALGIDRLRADLTRAAFLGTPNVQADPRVCRNLNGGGGTTSIAAGNISGWPAGAKSLASMRLEQNATQDNTIGLSADRITLSGAFASEELFPVAAVAPNGSKWDVSLQVTGPLLRATGAQITSTALGNIFQAGRILRLVDTAGHFEFAVIDSSQVDASGRPKVTVAQNPTLPFRSAGGTCGIEGNGTGIQASVLSWVRYEIADMHGNATYAPLYAASATAPGDDSRRELVRTELDASFNPLGASEIVAEYAIDLKFAFSVASAGTAPALTRYDYGDANNGTVAGDVTGNSAAPQRIRNVRAKLAVRSREADRQVAAPNDAGVLRYLMTNNLGYARVRTLMAEVVLPNLLGATW